MKNIFLMLLLLPCICVAQRYKPLKVGDKVPDVFFQTIVNAPFTKGHLSQFNKKRMIIEFWGSGCSACMEKFPMLDSLRNAYSETLGVTTLSIFKRDTKEVMAKLMARRAKYNVPVTLPIILGDTIMLKLFPMEKISKFAWIDNDMKLVAFTDWEDATPKKIAQFARGEKVDFIAREDQSGYDKTKPLFVAGNGGRGAGIIGRSTLTKYIAGIGGSNLPIKDSSGKIVRYLLENEPLLPLIRRASSFNGNYSLIHFPSNYRQQLLFDMTDADELMANSYTWELITPPIDESVAMDILRGDIERYLYYKIENKIMMTDCLVLKTDTNVMRKFLAKDVEEKDVFGLDDLAFVLDEQLHYPVIYEGEDRSSIEINLPKNIVSIDEMKQYLMKYGIFLKASKRSLQHLFITRN